MGAVLVPHGGTNAEFGDCRLAPQQLYETHMYVRIEAMGFDEVGGDFDVVEKVHGGGFSASSPESQMSCA